jgi:hypothetical protein
MIMIPILILQIFLFPLTAAWIMNNWVDSRRTLALQETASYIGSSVQQVYSSLNHATISAGTVTNKLDVPPFIEDFSYVGNATLRSVLDPGPNSSKVLEITLRFVGLDISAKTSITFGQNIEWQNSTFVSNSTYPRVTAEKLADGVIRMYFGS